MKLAFVSAHPAPYRNPFLKRLVSCSEIETRVFTMFANDGMHDYWNLGEHGYDSVLIGKRTEHWTVICWRLLRQVLFGGFDVICWPGFHRPCVKVAIVLSALLGKRYGFCADSVKQPKRSGLIMMIKKFVVGHADFIFVPGEASCRFYEREFGVPRAKLCKGQYAIEGDEVEKNILNLRQQKAEVRAKYGLKPEDEVYLMVANMLKTRHYPITAKGFVEFAEKCPNAKFVMVGKGDDLELMRVEAAKHPELVVVPGVSFAEMQELYAIADVYVHGGTEPASSALVIGAIAHLPLISSEAVGCTFDVVKDGETGALVPDYLNSECWRQAFERLHERGKEWSAMGERARLHSRVIDCDNVVSHFVLLARGVQ